MSNRTCRCLEALMRLQELPGQKGLCQFIDAAQIMNLETGESVVKPVLRALKHGKDGRLNVAKPWFPVYYCPKCGTPVKSWAQPEPEDDTDAN